MTYAVPGPIRTNIISSTSVGGIDSPFYSHEGCPRHDERMGNNESRN